MKIMFESKKGNDLMKTKEKQQAGVGAKGLLLVSRIAS